jgi:hypothetical protein
LLGIKRIGSDGRTDPKQFDFRQGRIECSSLSFARPQLSMTLSLEVIISHSNLTIFMLFDFIVMEQA